MTRGHDSANLDLLRATAVLFVLAFHLLLFFDVKAPGPFQLHSLGHWGVLLFFIHTSLVLMFSLERQQNRAPEQGLSWVFFGRRCFRVLPLSTLVVLAIALFHWPVAHLHDRHFQAVPVHTAGLLSNLLLIQNLTGNESILATLWSLPYEMQMYLVLPLLFVFSRRSRTVYPLLMLWVVAALLAEASFHAPRHILRNVFEYAPCFVPGIIAYKLSQRSRPQFPFLAWPVALALATAIFLQHPVPDRGWICCLLIGASVPQFREMPAGYVPERVPAYCALLLRHLPDSLHLYLVRVRTSAARAPASPLDRIFRNSYWDPGVALSRPGSAHDFSGFRFDGTPET